MKQIILVEENPRCGWCKMPIEDESATEHALTCKKQPLNIYKEELGKAMTETFMGKTIPEEMILAMAIASTATTSRIRGETWRYGDA